MYFIGIKKVYTNVFYVSDYTFNSFVRTHLLFTIVFLTWYYFKSHSILLTCVIFRLGISAFVYLFLVKIIYIAAWKAHKGL